MNSVEYRRQSVNSTGSVHFSHINLKNDDIKTIFLISSQYNAKGTLFKKKNAKGTIVFDASLVRSFEYIKKKNRTWHTKKSRHAWRNQMKKSVCLIRDLLCCLIMSFNFFNIFKIYFLIFFMLRVINDNFSIRICSNMRVFGWQDEQSSWLCFVIKLLDGSTIFVLICRSIMLTCVHLK